ncbi:MAG TPA: IPT/TIG domain-containing protein [Thermoanaerobaculia bacterium]|nr:IPT/TIG domain-containing protein [Thermoanaerobaculia bacterium]
MLAQAALAAAPVNAPAVPGNPPAAEVTEDLEGRMRDYLMRHGDNGKIDPQLLLTRTREIHEQLEHDIEASRKIRTLSIPGNNWVSLGPTNGAGRILSVATDPTVTGTAIVGSAGGGAWKTTDFGQSWIALTDTIPNLAIGAVAIAQSSPSIVYLGTGEAGPNGDRIPGIGILSSNDGGLTWTLPASVLATGFHRISVHPSNPQELVVATNSGAYRSTNGIAGPWTQTISGTTYGQVADLVRDPSNPLVIYAATWDGANCTKAGCSSTTPLPFATPAILKSTDGGKTFVPAITGFPVSTQASRLSRISLAIAPSSSQTLYASVAILDTITSVEVCHVFKTTNGGASWTDTNLAQTSPINNYLTAQAGYDNTIVVQPSDPNTVLAGGVRYIRTTDGGQTWTTPSFSGVSVHSDAHDMRYDAAGVLFIANDGGVWTSTDNAVHVTPRNGGLVTRQFYYVTNDPTNPNRIFGGLQDNGTIRRADAGGTSWDSMVGGDGIGCLVNPAVPSIVYASVQNEIVVRTVEGGASAPNFREIPPLFPAGELVPFRTLIVSDPSNPAVIYTPSYRLWKSADAGDSWVPLPTTTVDGSTWRTDRGIAAIAVSKSNPKIIMVSQASAAGVFRTTDSGATWRSAVSGLPFKAVTSIAIDPVDPNRAWLTTAGLSVPSVYTTIDGGGTWTAASAGLPAFSAQSILVDPTDSSTIYCGTDVGVYRSTDFGASWSRFGTGLPAVGVDDLKALDDGSALRAATHGRGMWELTITGATNHRPVTSISTPATLQTIQRGTTISFTGTGSDPDSDPFSLAWVFPDTWETAQASNGAATSHTFNRPGRFPVTLRAIDSKGAIGASSIEVDVMDAGDSCQTPIVIPSAGPFPWSVTMNTEVASRQASDPANGQPCVSFGLQRTIWLSFTPAVTGSYDFSLCGSRVSATMVGYTGAACGPYTASGFCYQNPAVSGQSIDVVPADCSTGRKNSVVLTAGTTIRFLVWNFYAGDFGPITLTVTQSGALTPVVTAVSPAVGSAAGGSNVVISGAGFVPGTSVKFGDATATNITVLTANVLTATVPAGTAGTATVSVQLPNGASSTLANAFVYQKVESTPRHRAAKP